MKTIKESIIESIIGRRGVLSRSEVWIMFPIGNDYMLAKNIFPEEYRVRVGANYVFCIDDVQWLKRYFNPGNNKYPDPFSSVDSELCVIKCLYHSHFKNLDQIKKWLQSVVCTEDIYQSSYVDYIEDVQKYIETL